MKTTTPDLTEFKADWDWRSAFSEASSQHSGYGDTEPQCLSEVAEIIAADPGENDGPEWISVTKQSDGRYLVMRAGCDYTGWDCRAGGKIEYYATLEEAVSKLTLTEDEQQRLIGQLIKKRIPLDWFDD